MLFWPILGHFWCSVVPLVTFSSNLNNLKTIKKKILTKKFRKTKKSKKKNLTLKKYIFLYQIFFLATKKRRDYSLGFAILGD